MENIKTIIKTNKSIINNIMGAFIVRGGSILVSLVTTSAYFRYFQDQNVLGLWFTILSVLNWILLFDLGIGHGLRNKLTIALVEGNEDKARKYISSAYISMTILILVICIVSILVFPHISWNNFFNIDNNLISNKCLSNSVIIVFIGIMIQFVLKLITSILLSIQKSAIVNLLILISNIFILGFVLFAPVTNLEQNLINLSWINVISVNVPLVIATVIIFSTTLKNCSPRLRKYSSKTAMEILKVGIILLWLQVVFMIISSTNEFLISHLADLSSVVEYQVYNKIFSTGSSVFILALVPIWSAVTKAQAENNYLWIQKLSKVLLALVGIAFIIELLMIPFLQTIVDIWLGKSTIHINTGYAIIFALSNCIFILHNVNISLANGMSYFKNQIIWMTFAAVVNIPLSILFVQVVDGWIGVIMANIFSLLPYEIIEPFFFNKHLNEKCKRAKMLLFTQR